jgi:diketogulonate reductase-like aldo/keto reductase
VRSSVEGSLEALGVDAVDLLLIHWPHPRVPVAETLDAMAALREEGVVEHLGVSNFTRAQLVEARDAVQPPIVTDQVLYHPYKDQSNLHEYCVEEGVALTAYSPLARGDVLDDPILSEIGRNYDKSAPQVALRWLVQQAGVVAIPKTTSRDHLADNLAIFDFELTDEEMDRIDALAGGIRRRLANRLPGLMRRSPF